MLRLREQFLNWKSTKPEKLLFRYKGNFGNYLSKIFPERIQQIKDLYTRKKESYIKNKNFHEVRDLR